MRYDIVSDTHGFLSRELLRELEGADVIVHAGDMCSTSDYQTLAGMAELKMCLGNNDYADQYGPFVRKDCRFYADRLRWQVCHYRERLDLEVCEIAICGHTHRPFTETDRRTGTLIMNPGSPTYPRALGPSMGRIIVEDARIVSAEIVMLEG
ncbi:metallophosphoesterase family protein [Olsenella urininfantis]|uniref:metallophosphoesterase family protein n=1 Tax=Olsenella urininfantis TaxID=1871033 RepID=UPI000985C22F|nr:metallophosphoesterase family protein [Olsenella urininfantis]